MPNTNLLNKCTELDMISPSEQLKAEEGGLWVGDTSVGRGLGYMSQNSLPRGFQLGEATGGIFLWYLKGRGEGATTVVCLCSAVWAGTCAATLGWLGARAGSANAHLPLQPHQLPDSRTDVCLAPAPRTLLCQQRSV